MTHFVATGDDLLLLGARFRAILIVHMDGAMLQGCRMAEVFLSYKRDQRPQIEQLAEALRKLKLTVWFDASLNAGEAFSEEIDREATEAKAIVVCWSPGARDSRWVKAEALIGFEQNKLAAVYVAGPDEFNAPAPFNSLHTEDLRDWLEAPSPKHQGWRSLLRRLGALCTRDDLASIGKLVARPTLAPVGEVFATANPTYTLVDRSKTPEFRRINRELRDGGKIIRLHGPSKSGKTVLCRQILRDAEPVLVYGSDIDSRDQYWTRVSQTIGVPLIDAPRACAEQHRALVIEDFHWVDRSVQAPLIKSLKPFIDLGGTAVILSVPDVAEVFLDQARRGSKPDPILGDLLAKSVPVSAPQWTEDEIREIAEVGYKTLGLLVSEGTLNVLARFSFKNPLLMQKHCSELCFNLGIDEALKEEAHLQVTEKTLVDTFQRVASIDGAFFHQIITKGGSRPFQLATGKKVTLRELVLFAITQVNINQKIGISRVAKNLARLLAPNSAHPDRTAIKKAFDDLIADMRKAGQQGLVIDDNNYLYIAHPFFKSYLVWILAPHCGALVPDLEQYIEPSDND